VFIGSENDLFDLFAFETFRALSDTRTDTNKEYA
jgi:hypothetical protein